MNIKHYAWWQTIRYMEIWVNIRTLHVQYTAPRPRLVDFASWIDDHIWYIFNPPAARLRYRHYTYAIPLVDARFVLLFAGDSRDRLTDIFYYVTWTLYYYNKPTYTYAQYLATAKHFYFFRQFIDEDQLVAPPCVLHFSMDECHVPAITPNRQK
jgi:hypothetical protein